MTVDQQKFWAKYYGTLIGATVQSVQIREDDEGQFWPVIKFHHPEVGNIEVEVSRDEEGNGPGFLFGLTIPS